MPVPLIANFTLLRLACRALLSAVCFTVNGSRESSLARLINRAARIAPSKTATVESPATGKGSVQLNDSAEPSNRHRHRWQTKYMASITTVVMKAISPTRIVGNIALPFSTISQNHWPLSCRHAVHCGKWVQRRDFACAASFTSWTTQCLLGLWKAVGLIPWKVNGTLAMKFRSALDRCHRRGAVKTFGQVRRFSVSLSHENKWNEHGPAISTRPRAPRPGKQANLAFWSARGSSVPGFGWS